MPRSGRRGIPRRGYLMLLVGIMAGALLFLAINMLFPRSGTGHGNSGAPDTVEFEFLYTSEKQAWIQEMTPLFEESFKSRFGIDVRVKLSVMGSQQTVGEIVRGSKPVAWSPASRIWIDYLNHKWNEAGHAGQLARESFPLVVSPTVLCTWESFVKKYNITGFADLYRLAKEGTAFKFGHPDPQLSNGGITTLIMMFAEKTGRDPTDFTLDDITASETKAFAKVIESQSVYYGSSTGFFGSWAVENGPSGIDVFGVYENVVLENSYKAKAKWDDRLIAVYPEGGLVLNDHPFVILEGDWIDFWQRFAANQYLSFLLGEDSQWRAQKHGFRPANPSVQLDTSVFSKENGVTTYLDRSKNLGPPSGDMLSTLLSVWVDIRAGGV